MPLLDYIEFFKQSQIDGLENTLRLFYGIYHGIVSDNNDPQKQGRIKVKVPQISGNEALGTWAYPIAKSGKNSGFFAVPEIGDGVWVSFENGNPRFPQWNGGWWANREGTEIPSEAIDDYPDVRIWKSTKGHFLLFNDRQDIARLENSTGGFVEIANNLVKLYGESEPAVLGDKNGVLHNDHIAELKNTITEISNLILALNTAMNAFGVADPPLLAATTAFTTATAAISPQLTAIVARLTSLQNTIDGTKSDKVKLD